MNIQHFLYDYFVSTGISEVSAKYLNMFALLIGLMLFAYFIDLVFKKIIVSFFIKFSVSTKTNFDNFLVKNHIPRYIAHIFPLIICLEFIPLVFVDFDYLENMADKLFRAFGVILILLIVRSFFNSIKDYFKTLPNLKDKPIDSYIQVIMIFVWLIAVLSVFAILTGIEFIKFITTLGAASAVVILIFKDTILGFVASIQVTINDIVRIGDWITFETYDADGTVTEITLSTVKVQNFDNTITTIPTYALISNSFKNWRGMEDSGGRRIKRAINIQLDSIHYLSKNEVEDLMKISSITAYLRSRQADIETYNTNNKIDKELLLNGRNLTNIGVFRKYVQTYIENHSGINKKMMIMVRQLAPSTQGIPIEIYAFSSDKRWENYEYIMADIFDHITAAVPYFNLEIFELPSNSSFKNTVEKN